MKKKKEIGPRHTIEYVEPSSLKPAPYNPRSMTPDERRRLKRSLREFGIVDPFIARREDRLMIGGHQRLAAAIELKFDVVPVVFLDDIDDDRAAALNVVLNNPGVQGEWDLPRLSEVLSELDANGFDATLTGFDEGELEKFLTWSKNDGGGGDGTDAQLGDVDYQVVVSCPGEAAQAKLCQELEARGLKCRLLTL